MARNPIIFENGALVQKANVEIDGTIYEVEPAQYQGNTPLSANNLNQLQENLYDYIDEQSEEIVENIGDITYIKNDYAIISDSIIISSTSSQVIDINYPTGFNANNCVVISQMATPIGSTGIYASGKLEGSSSNLSYVDTSINPRVTLRSDDIRIVCYNHSTNQVNISYKVVLMKIS